MSYKEFYANGVLLPSPSTVNIDNNKIWSDNTGRSVTAKMIGDIIAKKKKFAITWELVKESQLKIIEENLSTIEHPFVDFAIRDSETKEDSCNIKVYDGVLKAKMESWLYDGETVYTGVSVELVEQ